MLTLTKVPILLALMLTLTTGCGGGSSEDGPAGSGGTAGNGGTGGSAGGSGSGGAGGGGGDVGTRFSQLTAWGNHSCGLLLDGSVRCWGSDAHADDEPPSSDTFEEIHTANTYSCGVLTNQSVACWGEGQGTAIPDGESFETIALGFDHACGLRANGTVLCWGGQTSDEECASNEYNCGQGLSPAGTFTQIAAGHYSNCGLREEGTVECWGAGRTDDSISPNWGQALAPSGSFVQLFAGFWHYCALDASGEATCWGAGTQNVCSGPPICTAAKQPHRRVKSSRRSGSAGFTAAESVLMTSRLVGVPIDLVSGDLDPPSTEVFDDFKAGQNHSCGLRADGVGICWGYVPCGVPDSEPCGTP